MLDEDLDGCHLVVSYISHPLHCLELRCNRRRKQGFLARALCIVNHPSFHKVYGHSSVHHSFSVASHFFHSSFHVCWKLFGVKAWMACVCCLSSVCTVCVGILCLCCRYCLQHLGYSCRTWRMHAICIGPSSYYQHALCPQNAGH